MQDHDTIKSLKSVALSSFDAAIKRADPEWAVRNCIKERGVPHPKLDGKTIAIAVGKAAPAMLRGLQHCVDKIDQSICVTHRENTQEIPNCELYRANHPVPDEIGEKAATRIQEILRETTENDVVLVLISGGGSALMPAPVDGVTLAEKQTLNKVLLASGMDIDKMNLVRQQVSKLKGGGLLELANPTPVTSYILSDVIGNDLRVIASGPTVSPIGTAQDALKLLKDFSVIDSTPKSIIKHLNSKTDSKTTNNTEHHLIGDNRQSVNAAAHALKDKFDIKIMEAPLIGDVNDAAHIIFDTLNNHKTPPKNIAILWGGETTVQLKGNGLGGRNQELALKVALLAHDTAEQIANSWVFLSGGTDGRDGPTNAAGAIVDAQTIIRIKNSGQDIDKIMENNDSYTALKCSDDLIISGATGTNVADIQVLIIHVQND